MGYVIIVLLYNFGVMLYYVGPFLLLIGGAVLLTVGFVKRVTIKAEAWRLLSQARYCFFRAV